MTDDEWRAALFDGQLFVYSPSKSSLAFIEFVRMLIEEAFRPHDPEMAQFDMPVEQYAGLLTKLKPNFIHHPEAKGYLQVLLHEMGCDLNKTYFDVPKMRSSTSEGYLTTGIAYAWHPHRDTWYSAPSCQINWWIPIYDIRSDNAIAFHSDWNQPGANNSKGYNYYELNQKYRGDHIGQYLRGPASPSETDPAHRSRPANPTDHPSGRDDTLSRCPAAFQRAEYFRTDSVQY